MSVPARRVKTLQVGNKLIILNGVDPIRYVDLTKNTVKVYPRKGTRVHKIIYKFKKEGK